MVWVFVRKNVSRCCLKQKQIKPWGVWFGFPLPYWASKLVPNYGKSYGGQLKQGVPAISRVGTRLLAYLDKCNWEM